MPYLLRVRSRFEAAHHLTSYRGAPEPNHGHSWQVEAAFAVDELDDEGIGVDFVAVRGALDELAGRFDHGDLNAHPPFDRLSPTTERIAEWFFEQLVAKLPASPPIEVTVWEGPSASATYLPSVDSGTTST
jgi:6-pyruvoyltetrahydropterin/6-carboxytetrahydropterin synthase